MYTFHTDLRQTHHTSVSRDCLPPQGVKWKRNSTERANKTYQEKDKHSSKQWMKAISQFTKKKKKNGKKKIGLYFNLLKPTSIKWAFTILCTLHSKFCSRKWNKVASYKILKYSKKCQTTYSPVTDRKTLKGQVDNLGWQGCQQMDIFIHQWWEFKLGHNCAGI